MQCASTRECGGKKYYTYLFFLSYLLDYYRVCQKKETHKSEEYLTFVIYISYSMVICVFPSYMKHMDTRYGL
jgi:hypothetical protein